MDLIFATQNPNKVQEIQSILDSFINIKSLLDLDYVEELKETQNTLEGNALQKARFVYKKFGLSCFADDTGLEIEAINGEPGVYSARYAGEEKSFEKNMGKVLSKMKNIDNRNARFRTVIALIHKGKEYLFEGICEGEITEEKSGDQGFGYDPIFKPKGFSKTFAEMSMKLKNEIGHRGKAIDRLVSFLNQLSNS